VFSASSRVGVLFDQDWDAIAHGRMREAYDFDRQGFEPLSLIGGLRTFALDLDRYADRLAQRGRARRWAAVVSHHELYGALVAAMVAERLGLPGPSVRAVLACQHKHFTRTVLQAICPEANLRFTAVDPAQADSPPDGQALPVFVKPVRATFSVLARTIDSPQAWVRFFASLSADRWLTRRFLSPFEQALDRHLPEAGSSLRFLAEEPVWHPQYNLDGYVDASGVQLLGVVDAVSYPGTQAFQRWEFPSRLPQSVIARALEISRRFLGAVGFGQGFFNMEFFYDATLDRIAVIEFNPRLSSQFGDLYRMVLGLDPHAMAFSIALGAPASAVRQIQPTARVAASLVWRAFSRDEIPARPSISARARLAAEIPQAGFMQFSRSSLTINRELSWLESHRYGVINLGAEDAEALRQQSTRISGLLGWPNAPYAQSLSELALGHGEWSARWR